MARATRPSPRSLPPPEVMTIGDLAEYLQISTSSLYKLVQSGKVPGQKVGKHWRFSRTVINEWLASSRPRDPGAGRSPVDPGIRP